MEAQTIILILVGILQIVVMFILKRLFDTQDKLFSAIYENDKNCRDKIEKESEEGRRERELMKTEYTALLDKHYVTVGQLNTLEEKLIGQIKNLSISIEHLTEAIKNNVGVTK